METFMTQIELFNKEKQERIEGYSQDIGFQAISKEWVEKSMGMKYVYNFNWLGRPIIQYPQDIMAVQELVWSVKPDLIIETGIAHGGSLILSASMLAMLDLCEAIDEGVSIAPASSKRKVLGIDIDIRSHNREAIEEHPMSSRIQMIQGSSVDPKVVSQVKDIAQGYKKVMVFLDSNHTYEHVLGELEAYAELTSVNSYCVVFDTFVEEMPEELFPDRPWAPGNSPKTAVREFLAKNKVFEIDKDIQNKLLITVATDGFLKRQA